MPSHFSLTPENYPRDIEHKNLGVEISTAFWPLYLKDSLKSAMWTRKERIDSLEGLYFETVTEGRSCEADVGWRLKEQPVLMALGLFRYRRGIWDTLGGEAKYQQTTHLL